jgi:hypothetical protein
MRSPWLKAALAAFMGLGLYAQSSKAELPQEARPFFQAASTGIPKKIHSYTFNVGHATFFIEDGLGSEIRLGDKVVGLFIKGDGLVDYTSELSMEAAVLKYNLEGSSTLHPKSVEGGTNIQDKFSEIAIWALGQELPSLGDQKLPDEAKALAFAFEIHQSRFVDESTKQNKVPQFLSLQALNRPKLPAIEVQCHGGKADWDYSYDRFQALEERLYLAAGQKRSLISWQPIGWHAKEVLAPDISLVNADLNLQVRERLERTVLGHLTAKITLVAHRKGLRAIPLDLVKGDPPDNEHQLISVVDALGKPVGFDHRLDQVVLFLDQPLETEKPTEFTFEIEKPLAVLYSSADYWEMGVYAWFPMPGTWNAQSFTVHAVMTVPKPYLPIMGGDTIRRVEEKKQTTLEVRIDKPIQFFTMHAGNYLMAEEKAGNLTVRVASSKTLGGHEKKLANLAIKMIQGYESFLGPFPMKEFNIIQRPTYGHGQAPAGVMAITSEAFQPLSDVINQAYSKGVTHRFAHEIAHQWWGTLIKMPTEKEQWITESFAEYCSALMLMNTKNQGKPAYDRLWEGWERQAGEASSISSIAMANHIANLNTPQLSFANRTALVYDKGALMLGHIHKAIGDKAFGTFLRGMTRAFAWQSTSTLDIQDGLKEVSGQDFAPFFDKYFWGTEKLPPLKP